MSSSQDAKAEAQAWAARAGFNSGIEGKIILLPDFEKEGDCRFFFPDRSLIFHRMILKATGRAIRVAGGKLVMHKVSPRDYRRDRGDQEDTIEARAAWLATQAKIS